MRQNPGLASEIHGYRNHDLFEALSPDPTRRDVLVWITSYAGLRHADGIPLHDLLKLGKSGDDPRMLFSWYAADYTTDATLAGDDVAPEVRANPSMSAWGNDTYLSDQKRRLPAHKYRRLHLNLPGAPDGAAFDADTVMDAIVRGRKRLSPQPGREYHAFVDMSGGSAADAVLGIAHGEDGRVVLDALVPQTGAPPFNPRAAIRKFVDILREYRVARVTGDRFAGETFRQDFKELGIAYDISDLSRSQIYDAFEPRLNAGVVELLDLPKLQEQLLSLVRKGSGHIDHQSGDFDDWANAAAGCCVMVATDLAPALIRVADLYAAELPLPLPPIVTWVAAVTIVGIDGTVAVAYFAAPPNPAQPLVLLDVDLLALGNGTFTAIDRRVRELSAVCRAYGDGRFSAIWTTESLVPQIAARGLAVMPIPAELLADPAALALVAAAHVAAGGVKLAAPAHEKRKDIPLAGAFAIRAGDDLAADPLRLAVLVGIAIGRDPAGLAA